MERVRLTETVTDPRPQAMWQSQNFNQAWELLARGCCLETSHSAEHQGPAGIATGGEGILQLRSWEHKWVWVLKGQEAEPVGRALRM